MSLRFRFAIASDLHTALPHTIPDNPFRFHRVEISIAAFEQALDYFAQLDIDFLLLPGDLTQDGEPDNHAWLSRRLAQLPYPVYVVPGNHDALRRDGSDRSIGIADFPRYYAKFGYTDPERLYYTTEILPGVRLIGLNSIFFDETGEQLYMGRLDQPQLTWLRQTLATVEDELVIVMVHHNVLEHLPGQMHSPLGRRYMLENRADLLEILHQAGVKLIFTGHLHVQDIAHISQDGHTLYDITTGSLVSYPHPYRILTYSRDDQGHEHLEIESKRIHSVLDWDDLQTFSRNFVGDRSRPFMLKMLTGPPLNLPPDEAETLVPHLHHFWADIANGDAQFSFPQFPPHVRDYFERFSAETAIDNQAVLRL